ncbi:hypothetical protein PRIPAC_81878 [Pristionchus pacificus]|uniref:G protein-coupled receptor n=1 Tax=Pristionchus pacificus TaxID=54126 RepID=A0A2A6CNY4_PRIPA|nr:hypothetical protein PRIPAC_81878 [Pristionchus pacificus]|eukprot:PDM79808.1 G protein-coupled receptor [Pristionchus pacificus]
MTEKNENSIHFMIISTTIFIFFPVSLETSTSFEQSKNGQRPVSSFLNRIVIAGVLLCFLACHHCFSLAFEALSGIRMQLGPSMTRTQCFSSISIYIYCIKHQCCLVLVLVCDIAFCMFRPIKYHTIPVFPYVLACNPPLSYTHAVYNVWNWLYLAVNAATVIIYASALVYTACCGGISRLSSSKMSQQSLAAQQRIVKSLSALLIIFILSWFLGAVAP